MMGCPRFGGHIPLQRTWDGEASETQLQVHAPAPVPSAVVDPDLRLLETDRVNNWYPRRLHRSFNPLSVPRDAYTIAHLPYMELPRLHGRLVSGVGGV